MKIQFVLSLFVSITLFALCPSSAFAFGAIAVADNDGKTRPVFIVIGYDSDNKASQAVLDKCRLNGGATCRVVLNFERCGSIATSNTSYGVGSGVTGKIARNRSLDNCGDNCTVSANDCEDY